jgi:hypothetical protein
MFSKELGHIGKLDDRSTPGVFIGYTEGSKAYHILDPEIQRVRMMHDVVLDPGIQRWMMAQLQRTTTSPSNTSTLRELGE